MRIDNFDRGFLPWITSGVMQLKLAAEDNPLHEPALEASYQQTDAPLPVLVRRIGNFDLAKAARLDFDVASDEEITLPAPDAEADALDWLAEPAPSTLHAEASATQASHRIPQS